MNRKFFCLLILLLNPWYLFGNSEIEYNIETQMSAFIMSLAIIIIASISIGEIISKIGIPKVIGQIIAGVIISPTALGHIKIPTLFPLGITQVGEHYLISEQIYAIATIASIILLFTSGLQTDIKLFIKFLPRGGMIGIIEVVATFIGFLATAHLLFKVPLMSPTALFIGIIGVPTSASIVVSIISGQKKMSSSEGVTIISVSIIDDVLSIIMLTSIITFANSLSVLNITDSLLQIIKNVLIWIFLTFILIYLSNPFSKFLKKLDNTTLATVLTLISALILSSFFQNIGMSMVIGAYVFGLAISKTDISYVIQDKITIMEKFFIPVFFTSIGMMVDINIILSTEVLFFGILISLVAIFTKVVSCFIPSYILGFNALGASRIAFGMVPRGEVSLIIANIALSAGFINQKIFGITIIIVFLPTIIVTPIINFLLKINKSGLKSKLEKPKSIQISISFEYDNLAKILTWDLKNQLRDQNFFTQNIKSGSDNFINVRKNDISFIIKRTGSTISFECPDKHLILIQDLFRETILSLEKIIQEVQSISLKTKKLHYSVIGDKLLSHMNLKSKITKDKIILELKSKTKIDTIKELVNVLNLEQEKETIIEELFKREELMTTALKDGLAIPHIKTNLLNTMHIVIGVSKEGIDFQAHDQKLSYIFILIIYPEKDYINYPKILASIVGKVDLYKSEIIKAKTVNEVYNIIVG